MAVIDSIRSAAPVGLTELFHNTVAAVVAWNDARLTRKALAQLSDRQLEDIGLTRGEIDRLAL